MKVTVSMLLLMLCLLTVTPAFGQVTTSPSGHFHEPATLEEANLDRRANYAAVNIYAVLNATAMYMQDFGENPASVDLLVELEYLTFAKPTTLWWKFTFTGDSLYESSVGEPPTKMQVYKNIRRILAVGTENNLGATGDTLSFDMNTGEFGGRLANNIAPEVMARLFEGSIYVKYIQGTRASDAQPTKGSIYPDSSGRKIETDKRK